MTTPALESRLHALAARYDARGDTHAVRVGLARPAEGWTWTYGDPHAPYFLASTTKLFTTAVVLQLVDEGDVDLDGPMAAHLPAGTADRLHVRDGVDRTGEVTVRHLLAHTSGLPDYFEQRGPDRTSYYRRMLAEDVGWTFDDVLERTRLLRPRFAPGTPGRAAYSDTNYQLLGAVVERVTGVPYHRAVATRVSAPLGLTGTDVFRPETLTRYPDLPAILHRRRRLHVPRAMASFQPDGGITSTTSDSLRFLRAFLGGELFAAGHLEHMQATWRKVFPPLRYGTGLMRFALPRVYNLGRRTPPMIGHSGASGVVLYRVPELGLDVTAVVNQVARRSLPYQLMVRLVAEVARVRS